MSESDSGLYSLDRATYTHIVKESSTKKREKYEEFLGKVTLLTSMEEYEKSKLCDAFKELKYKDKEVIIT